MRTLSHGLDRASAHRLGFALLRAFQGEESPEMGWPLPEVAVPVCSGASQSVIRDSTWTVGVSRLTQHQ